MKKLVFLVILVCAALALTFAENFSVVSITGRVEKESGNQRIEIKVGEILDGDVIIHTGVGASVILMDENGKSTTVSAAKNGSIAELTRAPAPAVRVGGTISRTDTGAVSRTTAQVGTASARASTAVINVPAAAPMCSFCNGTCDDGCDEGCTDDCSHDN